MRDFRHKTVLITGSSRGIGLALALGFQKAGAKVIIHGRDKEHIKKISKQTGLKAFASDLSTAEGTLKLAEEFTKEIGRLDILINNAGLEKRIAAENIPLDDFQNIMHVNLHAPFLLIQQLLPLLKKAKEPSVINVSSVHETLPCPYNTAYCMAKAGLKMMTKSLASELAPYGIRINNLSPGAIETDMNREFIKVTGREKFEEWIGLGFIADADSLIEPVMFLACNESSYMTGASLVLDGGLQYNLVPYAHEE